MDEAEGETFFYRLYLKITRMRTLEICKKEPIPMVLKYSSWILIKSRKHKKQYLFIFMQWMDEWLLVNKQRKKNRMCATCDIGLRLDWIIDSLQLD